MKVLSILCTVLLVANLSFAQTWSYEAIEREARASVTTIADENPKKINKLNLVWAIIMAIGSNGISGESESYSGSIVTPSVGVVVPFLPLSKRAEVIGGVRFSKEGSRYESREYVPGGESQSVENRVSLSYLRVPVFVRINTRKRIYADAGIQPGFLLSAKDKHNGQTDDLKDDYKGFDMGLHVGVGYQFRNRFGAGLSFTPGITNINKKGGHNEDKKDWNRNLSFAVHYVF